MENVENQMISFLEKCEKQGYKDMLNISDSRNAKKIAKELGLPYQNIAETYENAVNTRRQHYVSFFEECEKAGYNDLSDSTQMLKAKVLAKDLGLPYQNIEDTFSVAAEMKKKKDEKDRIAEEKRQEAAKIAKEREARLALPGELLLTARQNDGIAYEIYRRNDGTFYSIKSGSSSRIEGVPGFTVKSGGVITSKVHPSELVYTGATVGGVSTGGFHQTEAYRTERLENTGTGYIEASIGSNTFTLESVVLSQKMQELFKRDSRVNQLSDKGVIRCSKPGSEGLALWARNFPTDMDILTRSLDSTRLQKSECMTIVSIIKDVLGKKWPASDEEICKKIINNISSNFSSEFKKLTETKDLVISQENERLLYSKAEALCESPSYVEIGHGVDLLRWLLNHIKPTAKEQSVYNKLLQDSKERAILAEEEYQRAQSEIVEQRRKEKEAEEARLAAERKKKLPRNIAIAVCVLALLGFGGFKYKQYSDFKAAEAIRLEEEAAAQKAAEEKAAAEAAAKEEAEKKAAIEAQMHDWSNIKVGDIKYLGSYEQDNNKSNGTEEIEWVVLAKEGNKALVISNYALDTVPFNTTKEHVTWNTCSLRKWLNDTFINTAFSTEEQSRLLVSTVKAEANQRWNTSAGKDTQDKVFILSIEEAELYFKTTFDRQCAPTDYARSKGYYNEPNYSNEKCCIWWLRNPGYSGEAVCDVMNNGAIGDYGTTVNWDKVSVRPAMWISY